MIFADAGHGAILHYYAEFVLKALAFPAPWPDNCFTPEKTRESLRRRQIQEE